ncbi:MAG TPA: peptidoglycan recognition family protein, partial [Pyrinomonadaceae bacterium]|nr:peptidoglycan recognition family protein [Pyrinomonadaceae bacterium]
LYTGAVWTSARVSDYLASRYGNSRPAPSAQNPVFTQVSAQHLPDYRAEKVWLVEEKDGHERYSNGGRILTEYETDNHARAFNLYARGAGGVVEAGRREPVGIVYHTSESDMLPFTADNNDSIETRTRGLLEFVRRNRSYNYLIDRFGQIYRVVRDAEAANHAGNSVWADERGVYVGLNESFIGVCFETNSTEETGEEQLTEAQLVSGRLLTQILRSRYGLDDANCVTHGLVSVNPDRMLVGFHRDWARDFPFAAFGLSDKYQPPTPALDEFGFTYDGELVDALGGAIWPGARAGEEQFKRRAESNGTRPDELRRRMRQRYRDLMDEQRRLRREQTPASAAEAAAEAG